jgi:hypothetical protein
LIDRWRQEYSTFRPHSALGYRPPAPEAMLWPAPKTAGPITVTAAVYPCTEAGILAAIATGGGPPAFRASSGLVL